MEESIEINNEQKFPCVSYRDTAIAACNFKIKKKKFLRPLKNDYNKFNGMYLIEFLENCSSFAYIKK